MFGISITIEGKAMIKTIGSIIISRYAQTPLVRFSRLKPEILHATNNVVPTGGVICPIAKVITMMMPK